MQGYNDYHEDQDEINRLVKERAKWKCIRCGHDHDFESSHVLTVHHFDLDKSNNLWFNLLPLCQRCHLSVQAKMSTANTDYLNCPEWYIKYFSARLVYERTGILIDEDAVEELVSMYIEMFRQNIDLIMTRKK